MRVRRSSLTSLACSFPCAEGKVVPGISEHVIFRYAPALFVQDAKAQLGLGVPLFG